MTRKSVVEYAEAVRERYLRALRAEKKVILDDFCKATGRHCRSAIRLLHRRECIRKMRRGRGKVYGAEFPLALKTAWQATDCICSRRLAAFLPELVPILERHGELRVTEVVRRQLMMVSASTIDRVLAPERLKPRHGVATTRSIPSFKSLNPYPHLRGQKGAGGGSC